MSVIALASVLTCPTAEEVDGGSLTITVKYKNYFPLVNQKKNLCDIPDILDEPCPLQAGIHDATISHNFPNYAPSVSYTRCHIFKVAEAYISPINSQGSYVGKVVAEDSSGNELLCIKLSFSV